MKIENRIAIASDLLRVGFAMEHAKHAAVALGGFHFELSCGESKDVGRDRLGFGIANADTITGRFVKGLSAVGDGLPVRGNRQLESEAGLQIRLIEAGKSEVRARRDEKRIHEIGIAIQGCIACPESDFDGVLAEREFFLRDDDVIPDESILRRLPVY